MLDAAWLVDGRFDAPIKWNIPTVVLFYVINIKCMLLMKRTTFSNIHANNSEYMN